jgi:hypothetical protein
MSRYAKPTDLLNVIGSHEIVNATILGECDFDTSCVPTYTVEQTARWIEARGVGGHVHGEPDDMLIWGWTAAEALSEAYVGEGAPGYVQGRGSIFRACKDALEKAGH